MSEAESTPPVASAYTFKRPERREKSPILSAVKANTVPLEQQAALDRGEKPNAEPERLATQGPVPIPLRPRATPKSDKGQSGGDFHVRVTAETKQNVTIAAAHKGTTVQALLKAFIAALSEEGAKLRKK